MVGRKAWSPWVISSLCRSLSSRTPHKHPEMCPSQNLAPGHRIFKGKDRMFSNKFPFTQDVLMMKVKSK